MHLCHMTESNHQSAIPSPFSDSIALVSNDRSCLYPLPEGAEQDYIHFWGFPTVCPPQMLFKEFSHVKNIIIDTKACSITFKKMHLKL